MLFYYPTTRWDYRAKLLEKIDGIFGRLESISRENKDLEQLEFHDMFREGVISPHCYYTAKYRYKNLILETGTLLDSHIGSSCWCTISAPKKEFCMKYKGEEATESNPLPEDAEKDYDNMKLFHRETDEYETVCEMSVQETKGFKYRWETFCDCREEIERLLFPEIYEEYDKSLERFRKELEGVSSEEEQS